MQFVDDNVRETIEYAQEPLAMSAKQRFERLGGDQQASARIFQKAGFSMLTDVSVPWGDIDLKGFGKLIESAPLVVDEGFKPG